MSVRITTFVDEYAQLATWTGESEAALRAEEDYHSGERELLLAWDGQLVVGAVHPWRSPDGRLRLYYDRCRADAYAPLAGAVDGECFATLDAGDQDGLAALADAGFPSQPAGARVRDPGSSHRFVSPARSSHCHRRPDRTGAVDAARLRPAR